MRGLAAASLLLCACSSGRYAGKGTSGVKPFTLERYDVYLANGLRVVIEPDHRSPVVALTTVIRTGAAADPAGKNGLAHLCARLTLRVSDDAQLPRRRAFVATAAADASAMADVDDTTLQAIGPSAALPRLLALHAAQLVHPLANLDAEALAAERTQIDRERHARVDTGDPLALVPELRRVLFASADVYANAPDGTADGLAAVGTADAIAFTRTHYRPDNATLAIVGDVDPAEVQALVTSIYGSPIRGPAAADADRPPIDLRLPELPPGPQLVTTTANVATPELILGWVLPGYYDTSAPSPDLVASAVHRILVEYEWPPPNDIGIVRQGQNQVAPPIFLPERMSPPPPASRSSNWLFDPDLVSLSRAPQEMGALLMGRMSGFPSVNVDSDIENVEAFAVPGVHATMLVCRVKLREGAHPQQTLENVLDHLRVLWEGRVRQDLFLTQPSLFSQMVLEAEAPSERSRLIASYASFVGGSHALSKTLERLLVPASHVEHFAWDRLTREQMRALVVMPRKAASRPQPPVWALGQPGAPRELSSREVGMPPGVRVVDPATVRSVTLPNGLEVILLKRPGIPIVTVSALLRVGTGGGRPPGVVDTALRITRPGRRYGNPSDFGVVETIDARPDAITIEQEGGAAHLGKMLAMLSDRLRSVTALRADLETFRKYTLPEWRREEHRPRAQADREFWKTLFGDHSYGFRAVAADLARVTLSDVERWVKRTYRPENVILVIAGDLEPDEAERLARTWLANWINSSPLPEGGVQVVPELESNEEKNAVVVTRNPGSPVAEVRMGCLLPDSVEERDIVAYDLAAEVLAQRLERGLPPAAAATVANDTGRLLGGTTALIIATTVSASAVTDTTRDLRHALDSLSQTGPTSLELDEARWSVARRHVLSVATTPATVQAVLETRKRGLSLSAFNRYAARIAITSPDQVAAVFQACNARKVLSVLADEPLASAAASEWKQP
jgi:zinc protease